MTTFEERERAFEAKFAHDEEFRFLVTARRDKLFAQWAAKLLQLSGQDRTGLINSALAVRDGAGHDDLLLKHMARAFSEHGRKIHDAELVSALHACAAQARQQLLDGLPSEYGLAEESR